MLLIDQNIDVPVLLIGDQREGWSSVPKPVEFLLLKQKMNELFLKKKSLSEKFIMYGDLKIDVIKKLVTIKDCILHLGMMEMAILISLARKTGQVVGRDMIRADLEAQGLFFNTTIQHHIWGLKQKLHEVAGNTLKVKLVLGQGFKLIKQS